eukprot:GFUD01027026.1.p1 GENE.GFUD01027026.1~~GFUD01027026.1.p1  ORF type:complete len:507 (+),score=146.42 GFUD01027026.1:190-1521(+)
MDKTGSIFAPALSCNIPELEASLVNRSLVRANLTSLDKADKSSTKPFVRLEVEIRKQNQGVMYFTILFEESLLKFLPQDSACYSTLYASFASTSLDKFLFIQFASINLQIRTLLLTRDQDLKRIFTEKSFFAVSRSTPTDWIKKHNFETNQVLGARLEQSTMSVFDIFIITIRNVLRNQFFEKDNYTQLSMELKEHSGITSFYLYTHATNVKQILSLFAVSRDTSVMSIKTDPGYILDIAGEKISVGEISKMDEIPINILRSSTFMIRKDIQQSFNNTEFFITRQKQTQAQDAEPVNRTSGGPSVEILCPFPSCKFKVVENFDNQNYDILLNHFLACHKDFSKVIMNQLRRHQEKKSTKQNTCPFENCDFTSLNVGDIETHYGVIHKIGQIVFLQFSLANKWKIDSFKQIGFISTFITSLVQCSHCFEVMTRAELASHIASLR